MKRREFLIAAAGTALAGARPGAARQAGASGGYTLASGPLGKTLHTPDGRTIFEYMTTKPAETDMSANSVCCFAPLNSPAGERLTVFGSGHRHYRGVFFGWHTVEFREPIPAPAPRGGDSGAAGGRGPRGEGAQGAAGGAGGRRGGGAPGGDGGGGRAAMPPPTPEVLARQNQPTRGNVLIGDYWGWGRYAILTGRVIKNHDVQLTKADRAAAELQIQNDWTIHDQVLMREALSAVVHAVPNAYVLDLTYKFTPVNVDVVLPEWSFGGFCVSGRSDAQSSYYFSSEGKVDLGNPSMVDGNTSWPDQPWYARTHVLDGKTAGYAVVNHASNPKTRWWNPPSTGNIQPSIVTYGEYTIPNGQPLTLKYRLVAYDGELSADRLNALSSEWRTA
jgi:Family of unknown function (DUF6807)